MKRMFAVLIILSIGVLAYSAWQTNRKTYPVTFGVHFSAAHATWLGLDPEVAFTALLEELRPPLIRLSADWNQVEKTKGAFDFQTIDWQMSEAEKHGAKVLLVMGQKTPHWPECHTPEWVSEDTTERKKEVMNYIRTVTERYRAHPALEMWQVENEPFILFPFGECALFEKDWIHDEISLVRALDQDHKIVVTDSGELGLWWGASRAGDYIGTTLYRTVRSDKGHVYAYDWLPPLHYRLKATVLGNGIGRLMISELQAEPWFTNTPPWETPIAEQEETFNPARFEDSLKYARHIGASRAYLWGAEWWYWMKITNNDSRYWDIAKQAFVGVE